MLKPRLAGALACASVVLAVTACNPDDLAKAQATQANVSATVTKLCGSVNAAASLAAPFSAVPQVGAILMYATASCATADAVSGMVAKAMADPNTTAWLQKLADDIRAVVPR